MSGTRMRRLLAFAIAIALAGSLVIVGGCNSEGSQEQDQGSSKTEEPAAEVSGESTSADAGADTTGDDGSVVDDGAIADDGSVNEPAANPPEEITISLFWVSAGENALGVRRTVPYTRAVATAAMKELLAGPTAAELETWPAIGTAIPKGTTLLGLTVENGVAKVNLSDEFDDGGGTFSITARLGQVVYTLTQFETVDAVEFSVEGERVKVFSSEGVILGRPQEAEDYYPLLPIDA